MPSPSLAESKSLISHIAKVIKFPSREGAASLLPGTTVDSVKEFAKDPIPLPQSFNTEAYDASKKEMLSLAQNERDKEVIQKALDGIQHITFAQLEEELGRAVTRFNEAIGGDPYKAIIASYKSNEWITQLALRGCLQIALE